MWSQNMEFASILTEGDPATTQEFHLIPPHPFVLRLIHLIHPALPLANSVSSISYLYIISRWVCNTNCGNGKDSCWKTQKV